MSFFRLFLSLALVGVMATPALAQVMQSSSYRIQNDSLNIGGARGTSTSYTLEDTGGEVATGYSTSSSYTLSAGYQQFTQSYISISGGTNVTLSPSIGGVTGGTSNGSTTVTVTTDDAAGYQLIIAASSSPAMISSSSSIPDYTPVGADPDFTFSNNADESQFGFSPEGGDITARFKDNGASCNAGSGDTALACWVGLSTTTQVIASRTSANQPSGTQTSLRFRVSVGPQAAQMQGTYVATTTLTAIPL